MLELIRSAQTISRLQLEDGDSEKFYNHARDVFNHHFHQMNTDIPALALFLHPLCRKLAVSQADRACNFDVMLKIALQIAQQWRWSLTKAQQLTKNLHQYHQCKSPFLGGIPDALEWWKGLAVSAEKCPLCHMAITLLLIVPHAAEIERLFLMLGGVQSARRCNLSVPTFRMVGELRANYSQLLCNYYTSTGKPIQRKHTHMHTRADAGIDTSLVKELETGSLAWTPPFSASNGDISAAGDTTEEDVAQAFAAVAATLTEEVQAGTTLQAALQGAKVLRGTIYDFEELDQIDKGLAPALESEEINIIGTDTAGSWTIEGVLGM
jgi:hypothetical protein